MLLGKVIQSNLVEMPSIRQLHLMAPIKKVQTEVICQFALMPSAPSSLMAMLHGPLSFWCNSVQSLVSVIPEVTQKMQASPLSCPGRLSPGILHQLPFIQEG